MAKAKKQSSGSNYQNLVKIRSPKHPGAIFVRGSTFLCKVYPYPNGNENNEEADVIIAALQKHRKAKSESNTI